MMAQAVPHQTQQPDRRRVKVYELRDNDWFDRGTGFCSAEFIETEDGLGRVARVAVESEEESSNMLLETKIHNGDGFQKQQETLIVWTEPGNGMDMALSFQEAEGCATIWKFVNEVQRSLNGELGGPDDSLSDDLAMDVSTTIQLPAAELGNLELLENSIRAISSSANGRDALAKLIMHEDYIGKLIPLVDMAEDLESEPDLHRLCNIIKLIILLNDTAIIEHAVSDVCVLGVVGALEYDPDFPQHKANHRQWLNHSGRYKEVVRIKDDNIRRRIHQTYRLQYMKDVVLARILDDPTFSVLNSMIFFNQVEIVGYLQNNTDFLRDLFSVFNRKEQQPLLRQKQAVLFIQQCCAIAKNLQIASRQNFYAALLSHGLLNVISFGLNNNDVSVRVGATDILVSMIDHDPHMIRHTLFRQIMSKQWPLTDTLIDLLLVEVDLGVQSQISDALKVLLDTIPPNLLQDTGIKIVNGELQSRPRPVQQLNTLEGQQHAILEDFYSRSAARLFRPLLALEGQSDSNLSVLNEGVFSYLNDILCFFARQHHNLCKKFIRDYNIAQRFVQLLSCKQKHLQLVAIRFFRHLINHVPDEFYIKLIAEQQVLGPILDVLLVTLPRDNLLSSACLDTFEYIRKEPIKDLIKHVVETYGEKLKSKALENMEVFKEILRMNDQQSQFQMGDHMFMESSDDEMGQRPAHLHGRMIGHMGMSREEEDYWDAPDNEDESQNMAARDPLVNGSGPLSALVDYHSDEEADENGDVVMKQPNGEEVTEAKSEETKGEASADESKPGTTPESTQPPPAPTPPERLSEKRRREEEDEDEIGKMMQHKRRNSQSSISNAAGAAAILRKKQPFVLGSKPAGMGTKKIDIRLNPNPQQNAVAQGDAGKEGDP